MFEFDNKVVMTRLIDGEYFDIDKIIPDNWNTKIIIDRRDFIDCLDRATLLISTNDKKPVVLSIGDELNVKIITPIGEMDEDIEIRREGEPIEAVGYNPRFLMDSLRAIDDDEVEIYYIDAKSPCIVKDTAYKYIILPVSLHQGV